MSLVIEGSPLAVLPGLAIRIGTNGALILQQIHYWLEKSKHIIDGCKWIYNSYESWHRQFPFISLRTIKREVAALRDLQLIRVERFQKHRWNQTNWYTIDYERLEALSSLAVSTGSNRSGQSVAVDCANLSPSITKTSISETSINTTTPTHHPVKGKDKQEGILTNLALAAETLKEELITSNSCQRSSQKDQETAKVPETQGPHQSMKPLPSKCYIKVKPTETKTSLSPNQADLAAVEPLLKQAEDLGIRLNQNLKKLVLSATVETIRNALGVLKQSLESRKSLKNPAGLLAEAIKQQWKPSQIQDACATQKAVEGFTEWFNLAYELRLVSASEMRDGVQYVYTPDGRQERWETLTATYPLAKLRLQVEQKRQELQDLTRPEVKAAALSLQSLQLVEKPPSPQRCSHVVAEHGGQTSICSQRLIERSSTPTTSLILLAEFREWVNLALEAGIISDSNIIENEMLVYSGGAWHEWTELSATFTTRYLRRQLKEGPIIRRE